MSKWEGLLLWDRSKTSFCDSPVGGPVSLEGPQPHPPAVQILPSAWAGQFNCCNTVGLADPSMSSLCLY